MILLVQYSREADECVQTKNQCKIINKKQNYTAAYVRIRRECEYKTKKTLQYNKQKNNNLTCRVCAALALAMRTINDIDYIRYTVGIMYGAHNKNVLYRIMNKMIQMIILFIRKDICFWTCRLGSNEIYL